MRLFVRLSLVLIALAAAGCGGDLGLPSGLLTRAVNATVDWGPITRLVAPPQAESAILTLSGASPDGSDYHWTIQRDLTMSGRFTETYTVPSPVRIGPTVLTAEFYATSTPGGTPIGFLEGQLIINGTGTTVIPITTVGPVVAISIFPGQSVAVGQTFFPGFDAVSADGSFVVLPPDGTSNGPVFNVVSGTNNLAVVSNGLKGIASGTAQVTCSIESVTSPSQAIQVTSTVGLTISPQTATISILGQQQFAASVSGNSATGINWSVQEGTAGGTVTSGGLYTAPATPGTYHVVASSQADPNAKAIATVTVQAGGTGVTIQ